MDEKDFKKHLQDLAHGHHHPEEHDWADGRPVTPKSKTATPAKSAARKTKRRSK